MLLLFPKPVNKRQVVEIQVSLKGKKTPSTRLVEACWTRLIPVTAQVKMYLVGTRFLFELPALSQSPRAH
jgi:hypothetical protein